MSTCDDVSLPGVADRFWVDAWFNTFAPEQAVAVGPEEFGLRLRRVQANVLGLPMRSLHSPTNDHSPGYDWPANLPPGALAEWLVASQQSHRWDLLQLDLLAPDARAIGLLRALPRPWRLDLRARWESPVVDMREGAEAYFSSLPHKLRKNLNRTDNGLRRAGTTAFVELAADADWHRHLDAALELESRGWKGHAGSGVAQSETLRAFYRAQLERFRARGALRLFGLLLDGQLIAFSLLLRDSGIWYGFKTGYDENYARHSPGNALFHHVLIALFEEGNAHTLDMLDPVTDWKRRWASRIEPRLRLRLYAPSWRGRLAFHGERAARSLYRWPAIQKLAAVARRSP